MYESFIRSHMSGRAHWWALAPSEGDGTVNEPWVGVRRRGSAIQGCRRGQHLSTIKKCLITESLCTCSHYLNTSQRPKGLNSKLTFPPQGTSLCLYIYTVWSVVALSLFQRPLYHLIISSSFLRAWPHWPQLSLRKCGCTSLTFMR